MAWFRPMGVDEVAYHQATVVGRGDDHAGAALDYYGSRGETPLRWGGAGAERLGLSGEVTPDAYEAAFGPGGFRVPETGVRLVASRRPGFELVVGAHKSVAVLGVAGHTEAMHSILDVETTATMAALDAWFQERGGRRGRVQERTATGGLVYATTRHATSRAGDPAPHDHVLIANVVEMLDPHGGFKALDSAALRDALEAATMVGRLHAAAHAVSLGFEIAPDDGPSGNLRHWRLAAVPDAAVELFSKRSDEIAEHLAESGRDGYRARAVAARATRSAKRHTGVDDLLPGWRRELDDAGIAVDQLSRKIAPTPGLAPGVVPGLTPDAIGHLVNEVLGADGPLLRRHKTFTRTHLIAELAPRLYGHDPGQLERVLHVALGLPDLIPMIGTGPVREQAYTTRAVLEAEQTIAVAAGELARRHGPAAPAALIADAIARKEGALGRSMTSGQRALVQRVCAGEAGVQLVVGVAGSGKTTALDAASDALEAAGHRVMGVSTSGQAAQTLGNEAGIDASTFASLLGRLDARQESLTADTVVIVDEAGMVGDSDLARLIVAASRAGAAVVLVGDHRQLPAVGPGGAFAALQSRHPELIVHLDENVRQLSLDERDALEALRSGDLAAAAGWYRKAQRITTSPTRTGTLVSMAAAWALDTHAGFDTALLAWRRADVSDLNRLARDHWRRLGRLSGPDFTPEGGRRYAVGERLVATAPNRAAGIVTSERLTITALDHRSITAMTDGGRQVRIVGEGLDRAHLDYGYAVTVHRAQGLTSERAHVLASGGGGELAYVAVSRARQHTQIHLTTADPADAVAELIEQWSGSLDEPWLSDTPALPGAHPEPAAQRVGASPATIHEMPRAHEDVVDDVPHPPRRLSRPEGLPDDATAWALRSAQRELADAQRLVADPSTKRRARRTAERSLDGLLAAVAEAQHNYDRATARWVGERSAERPSAHDRFRTPEIDEMLEMLDRFPTTAPVFEHSFGLDL